MRQWLAALLAVGAMAFPRTADAQGLTGALVGTVKDEQGGVLPGAVVRVTSASLIGGPSTTTTNEKGQLRFPVLELSLDRPEGRHLHALRPRARGYS